MNAQVLWQETEIITLKIVLPLVNLYLTGRSLLCLYLWQLHSLVVCWLPRIPSFTEPTVREGRVDHEDASQH